MNIFEQAIFQAGFLEGLSGTDRTLEDGDREILKQCAATIRRQSTEVSGYRRLIEMWADEIDANRELVGFDILKEMRDSLVSPDPPTDEKGPDPDV